MCAFGVDVLDPAVSLRRVWVLGNRLPPWARAGGEEWGAEAHLLALACDLLSNLTYITLQAAGAKGVTKPRPLPRPRAGAAAAAPQAPPQPPAGGQGWAAVAGQLAQLDGVRVIHGG